MVPDFSTMEPHADDPRRHFDMTTHTAWCHKGCTLSRDARHDGLAIMQPRACSQATT